MYNKKVVVMCVGVAIVLLLATMSSARTWTPVGNITLHNFYWIHNASNVFVHENVTANNYLNGSGVKEWIEPQHILDVDDEDVETDLNTYVDVGGDVIQNYFNVSDGNITFITTGSLAAIFGGESSGDDFKIWANLEDARPVIELFGNEAIWFKSAAGFSMFLFDTAGGNALNIYNGYSKLVHRFDSLGNYNLTGNITYQTNSSINSKTMLRGGTTSGDIFTIFANAVDALPYIEMDGGTEMITLNATTVNVTEDIDMEGNIFMGWERKETICVNQGVGFCTSNCSHNGTKKLLSGGCAVPAAYNFEIQSSYPHNDTIWQCNATADAPSPNVMAAYSICARVGD